MPYSKEIRQLTAQWEADTKWPQRLEWIEIQGPRGWIGQRIKFAYPMMAIVGENGAGKSTVIQCAAAAYQSPYDKPITGQRRAPKTWYGSDFFFKTQWDKLEEVSVRYSIQEGDRHKTDTYGKGPERWNGNLRRAKRHVEYLDLSRVLPVNARTGYTKIAKSNHKEIASQILDRDRLRAYSQVMGHEYDFAKLATTDVDPDRPVPVLGQRGIEYSGFNQGAGELTAAELVQLDAPKYSLIVIDEIESSLHPRTQRRLIRYLANRCREREWQIVLTTHSAYVLSELPPEARVCLMLQRSTRQIIYGVSPEFAMTHMDDYDDTEIDLYVEDERAKTMLTEIMAAHDTEATPDATLLRRALVVPYGIASTGRSLGLMVHQHRFPRRTLVFLDGDQPEMPGCIRLPGSECPERVVFESLRAHGFQEVAKRVGRDFAAFDDACRAAMALGDPGAWVGTAASRLTLGGDTLWQAMCAYWAVTLLAKPERDRICDAIHDVLIAEPQQATDDLPTQTVHRKDRATRIVDDEAAPPVVAAAKPSTPRGAPNGQGLLFGQLPSVETEEGP